MIQRRNILLSIAGLLVIPASRGNAQIAAADQRPERARQLLDGSRSDQSVAVGIVRELGSENLTPQLRAALIRALEQEGRSVARELRGEIPRLGNAELIAGLAQLVAAFRDPRAIPALTAALENSPQAIHALAEFGELAAPAVLERLGSTTIGDIENDALMTLRFMAEGVGGPPLTSATRDRMRQVARERLTTPQKSVVRVWQAIDLGIALHDAELRRIVKSLASDRNAVIALLDTDPDLVDRTRRVAAERLAGVLPQPRHATAEEFAKHWE